MKVICYTRPEDGGLSVVVPNMDCGLSLEEIAAKDVPDGLSYDIVDQSVIPTDRTDRNGWKLEFTGTGKNRKPAIKVDQQIKDRVDLRNWESELAFLQARGIGILDLMVKSSNIDESSIPLVEKQSLLRYRELREKINAKKGKVG